MALQKPFTLGTKTVCQNGYWRSIGVIKKNSDHRVATICVLKYEDISCRNKNDITLDKPCDFKEYEVNSNGNHPEDYDSIMGVIPDGKQTVQEAEIANTYTYLKTLPDLSGATDV